MELRLSRLVRRSSIASAVALVVVVGGLVPAGPAASQELAGSAWATRSAEVEIDLTAGDGRAAVVVRYRLGARQPGQPLPLTEAVPVELLDFGHAATEEIVLDGRGRLVLWPTVGSHRAARVAPPLPGVGGGPEAEGEVATLTFRYTVEGAVTFDGEGPALRARVPVLAGPAVLAETGETAFRATLAVPPAWSVTEGFPSGIAPTADGRYVVTLPVVPSVVGFRGRTDGAWRPGLPLLVDLLTVLILVGFAGVGWRYLRKVAA